MPEIKIFCICEVCEVLVDVTGKKRTRFCGDTCRKKEERERKMSDIVPSKADK